MAVLITAAIAPGVVRLELRTDGHALIPTHAPEIKADRAIREEFGVEDPIVIFIQSDHADGIFNTHTLALVAELTAQLSELDGIRAEDIVSLATEHGHRVKPGTLTFRRFLEPLPSTTVTLHRLRDDLRAIKLYHGTLVSDDETATTIFVSVPPNTDRLELLATIRQVLAGKGAIPEHIDVIGAPVAEALLGTHILEDLGVPSVILGHTTRATALGAVPPRHVQDTAPRAVARLLHEVRFWLGRNVGLVPVAIGIMLAVFLVCFRSPLA
ncbi:MAG: hypothetical protein IID38_12855, partial [Planctomycetes bacterium]|nr:hypothetical protein [Planctomycetota bacterium]